MIECVVELGAETRGALFCMRIDKFDLKLVAVSGIETVEVRLLSRRSTIREEIYRGRDGYLSLTVVVEFRSTRPLFL
jgi:hypothetical protein